MGSNDRVASDASPRLTAPPTLVRNQTLKSSALLSPPRHLLEEYSRMYVAVEEGECLILKEWNGGKADIELEVGIGSEMKEK